MSYRSVKFSKLSTKLALSTVAVALSAQAAFAQAVQRPPQFVLMAFDGSYSHNFWKDSLAFSRELTKAGKPLKFTYFISGVYYVGKKNKNQYITPGHGPGKSAIGWGEGADDLLPRYNYTNQAFKEGHEIASHANSHFGGSKWSGEQWGSEFTQFNNLIFNMLKINGLKATPEYPNGFIFSKKDVIGFRAPLLEWNNALFGVMAQHKFRYDTSKSDAPNYWPKRNAVGGHWNFPLARIPIAGTGKKTLSMDYNFYVSQSGGQPDPANSAKYEAEMYESYVRYFQGNYNGNRAPIHLGHHFSLWNGGAYWRAMKRLAQKVCGMPEVKCVTYKELVEFMDKTPTQTIAAYQAGSFSKGQQVALANPEIQDVDVDIQLAENDGMLTPEISGEDANTLVASNGYTVEFTINGEKVEQHQLALTEVRNRTYRGAVAEVGARILRNGKEVARRTKRVVNVGEVTEAVEAQSLEDRALIGDLPEAHFDERYN